MPRLTLSPTLPLTLPLVLGLGLPLVPPRALPLTSPWVLPQALQQVALLRSSQMPTMVSLLRLPAVLRLVSPWEVPPIQPLASAGVSRRRRSVHLRVTLEAGKLRMLVSSGRWRRCWASCRLSAVTSIAGVRCPLSAWPTRRRALGPRRITIRCRPARGGSTRCPPGSGAGKTGFCRRGGLGGVREQGEEKALGPQ
jgi:hypothetical protein